MSFRAEMLSWRNRSGLSILLWQGILVFRICSFNSLIAVASAIIGMFMLRKVLTGCIQLCCALQLVAEKFAEKAGGSPWLSLPLHVCRTLSRVQFIRPSSRGVRLQLCKMAIGHPDKYCYLAREQIPVLYLWNSIFS